MTMMLTVVGLASCGDDDSPSTTSTSGPSTTVPVIKYDQPSTVDLVGTGLVDGSSLDGSAVFVEEEDPRFPQLGCEGQPEPVLFRLPLAGGERELVGNGEDHLHGRVVHGQGEKIAIVSGCESFFTALWVGTESLDGRVTDLRKVPVQVGEGQVLAPFSISWSANGLSLLGAVNLVGGGALVVSIDPDSGALTTVFDAQASSGVSQVGQLADGSYVLAAEFKVSIRNAEGAVTIQGAGNGFELAPDLLSVVAYGTEVLLLAPTVPRPVRMVPGKPGQQVTSASLSPDGRAVVYNFADSAGTNEISLLTVADAQNYKLAGRPAGAGLLHRRRHGRRVQPVPARARLRRRRRRGPLPALAATFRGADGGDEMVGRFQVRQVADAVEDLHVGADVARQHLGRQLATFRAAGPDGGHQSQALQAGHGFGRRGEGDELGHLGPDDLPAALDLVGDVRRQAGPRRVTHQPVHEGEDTLRATRRGQAASGRPQLGVQVGSQRPDGGFVHDGGPHQVGADDGEGQHQRGSSRHAHERGRRHAPGIDHGGEVADLLVDRRRRRDRLARAVAPAPHDKHAVVVGQRVGYDVEGPRADPDAVHEHHHRAHTDVLHHVCPGEAVWPAGGSR